MNRHDPLTQLVEQLQRLPGIGAKSAQRLAYHVLKTPREEIDRLADAMREVKERVTYCSVCSNITDVDPCFFCTSAGRDPSIICVVEEPENVAAVEKTRDFKGRYHVLMGALSPLQGVGPDDLKVKELLMRVGSGTVEEVDEDVEHQQRDDRLPGAPLPPPQPAGEHQQQQADDDVRGAGHVRERPWHDGVNLGQLLVPLGLEDGHHVS